jgi:hypothetical protein
MAHAHLEMKHCAQFDPPDLPPVVAVEVVQEGWRGLTLDGIVLNVASGSIPYGDRVEVYHSGVQIGFRKLPDHASPGLIGRYLRCVDIAKRAVQNGHLPNALIAIETAMSFVPTLAALYSHGMIQMEMNRWREGLADYAQAMEHPGSMFARPQYRECIDFGLKRWRGEDISGKKLLLIHDHGFGDSIMMLRYVSILKAMGADVVLWLPQELERLAQQCASVTHEIISADYFCPLLFLLDVLQQTPETIPVRAYLAVDPALFLKWKQQTDRSQRIVGVAWTPGVVHEQDYPRAIPLGMLVKALPGARLISLQKQGGFDARLMGVEQPLFEDFADCAALMACCDEIVTIDTAAVHLAGAIGHPNIKLLLSHWASWRWLSPLYPNIKICRQDKAEDWNSALEKL